MDIAVPTGVDAGEVLRIEMESGLSGPEVIALAATVIGEANQYIMERMGGLLTLTERGHARYRQGVGSAHVTPVSSEFAEPDGVRADQIGHMLPRLDYKDATAWSNKYLRRAPREDVVDDLLEIKEGWTNRCIIDLLTRALSDAEKRIGQAGYDVPWVIGDSGQNVPYIPPQRGLHVFDETVTHFLRTNAAISASNAATALETAAKKLAWQGHTGRKLALVSESNLAVYEGMNAKKFVRVIPGDVKLVQGGSDVLLVSEGTLEGVPGELFGLYLSSYGVVELRYHERIPANYFWMTKSYGVNHRQNGLAIRTEPGVGFGMKVDPQISRSIVPALEFVLFPATHGVGVNDRTNGVAAQIASGGADYESPTVT
ncbi:MAG: hypothetical protein GY842_01835 [bacterium]|nr:hypothetical protein [bacterium]